MPNNQSSKIIRELLADLRAFRPAATNNERDYQRASESLRPLVKRTADLLGPQILRTLSYHPNDARNELLALIEEWMEVGEL